MFQTLKVALLASIISVSAYASTPSLTADICAGPGECPASSQTLILNEDGNDQEVLVSVNYGGNTVNQAGLALVLRAPIDVTLDVESVELMNDRDGVVDCSVVPVLGGLHQELTCVWTTADFVAGVGLICPTVLSAPNPAGEELLLKVTVPSTFEGGVLLQVVPGIAFPTLAGSVSNRKSPNCLSLDLISDGTTYLLDRFGDGDGVANPFDNCEDVPNLDQIDADADGCGNACDGDFDNVGPAGITDFNTLSACISGGSPAADPSCTESDFDGNGVVGITDFVYFSNNLFGFDSGPGVAGETPCR